MKWNIHLSETKTAPAVDGSCPFAFSTDQGTAQKLLKKQVYQGHSYFIREFGASSVSKDWLTLIT